MGSPKITGFIIALVIISFFASLTFIFLNSMDAEYNTDFDNSSLDNYRQLEKLSSQSEEIKNETGDIKEQTGVLDVIGSYFSSGYRVLLLTKDSFDVYDNMTDQAIKDANLGEIGSHFKIMITTIVIILIFVGVLLAAIFKWAV